MRSRFALLASIVCIAAAVPGLIAGPSIAQTETAASGAIAQITKSTGIVFPDGTRLVHMDHDPVGEQNIRAVVQLPKRGLKAFFAANHLDQSEFSKSNHGFLAADAGGWDPFARGPFPVFAGKQKNGTYLYLGYLELPNGPRVYVYWFMT